MNVGEETRQASILVTVLLTDGVITEIEAEILRQAFEPTNDEWSKNKLKEKNSGEKCET